MELSWAEGYSLNDFINKGTTLKMNIVAREDVVKNVARLIAASENLYLSEANDAFWNVHWNQWMQFQEQHNSCFSSVPQQYSSMARWHDAAVKIIFHLSEHNKQSSSSYVELLESQVENLNEEIADLKDDINDLRGENENLQFQLRCATDEIDTLNAEVDLLEEELVADEEADDEITERSKILNEIRELLGQLRSTKETNNDASLHALVGSTRIIRPKVDLTETVLETIPKAIEKICDLLECE